MTGGRVGAGRAGGGTSVSVTWTTSSISIQCHVPNKEMVRVARSDVNDPRTYDASGRRRRAHERRESVLDAAARLLTERGFAGTTVAAVAEASRVSPETVYKAFGTKAGL